MKKLCEFLFSKNMANFEGHFIKQKPLISEECCHINLSKCYKISSKWSAIFNIWVIFFSRKSKLLSECTMYLYIVDQPKERLQMNGFPLHSGLKIEKIVQYQMWLQDYLKSQKSTFWKNFLHFGAILFEFFFKKS